jgi:hypothetical protein
MYLALKFDSHSSSSARLACMSISSSGVVEFGGVVIDNNDSS